MHACGDALLLLGRLRGLVEELAPVILAVRVRVALIWLVFVVVIVVSRPFGFGGLRAELLDPPGVDLGGLGGEGGEPLEDGE